MSDESVSPNVISSDQLAWALETRLPDVCRSLIACRLMTVVEEVDMTGQLTASPHESDDPVASHDNVVSLSAWRKRNSGMGDSP